MTQQAHSSWKIYVLFALLIIAILVPRLAALDRFATPDEGKWVARSANFYEALASGQWAMTYQKEHPGVTIMWAGMAGYLWRYPTYVQDAPNELALKDKDIEKGLDIDRDIETYLRGQGYQPLELLVAGRIFIVLATTFTLAVSCFFAARLIGWYPALLAFSLIAFDPFHVALSRLLHLDGLLSCLMLLSVLAFFNYLHAGRRSLHLIVSALATGLAFLTKLPSIYLVPFIGLVLLIDLIYQWWEKRDLEWQDIWQVVWPFVAWGAMSMLFFVLFWPAMWAKPIGTLSRMVTETTTYVVAGHGKQLFFNGIIFDGDPGWTFYLINYLWRTTPIVLIGLGLAGLTFVVRARSFDKNRRLITLLLLFVLFFTIFMTLAAKKFDRYLLPIYPILDLVAAIGWSAGANWLANWCSNTRLTRVVIPSVITVVLIAQFAVMVPTYPYYLSYYNPLLGGSRKAPEVMQIGWGEGLDQAARYLNATPGIDQIQVMTWYQKTMFSYFFQGNSKDLDGDLTTRNMLELLNSDYAVFYIHQWQRQLPNLELLTFFDQLIPEKVIDINGLHYVKVYDLRQVPSPEFFGLKARNVIDWGGVIRLLAYELPKERLVPNQPFDITFYLGNREPIDHDLSVLVRLINSQNEEILRDEGWPAGRRTTSWAWRDVWTDKHELMLPPDTPSGIYRLELGFYNPATLERLPAQDAHSSEAIGDIVIVDYLQVGEATEVPPDALRLQANLGEQINLLAAKFDGLHDATIGQGETLLLRLFWQASEKINTNYTIFVHVLGPDGKIITQADQQPLAGFLPTTFWKANQVISDQYQLQLPPDAPIGSYQVVVGMYDFTTGQRLPISLEGEVIGDAIDLGPLSLELNE